MKNTNKIRQLLKSIEWIHVAFHEDDFFCPSCKRSKEDGHYKDCQLKQALALLPCETCGGTGKVPTPQSVGFGHENEIMDTCPNCQPKLLEVKK